MENLDFSKMKFCHTYFIQTKFLAGVIEDIDSDNLTHKIIVVSFNITGNTMLNTFSDIGEGLNFKIDNDLVFKYFEHSVEDNNQGIKFIIPAKENFVAAQNIIGINKKWKLYINDKSDIVVQHKDLPENKTTIRFKNFPGDDNFYVHLSCLILILKNEEFDTELELKELHYAYLKRVNK